MAKALADSLASFKDAIDSHMQQLSQMREGIVQALQHQRPPAVMLANECAIPFCDREGTDAALVPMCTNGHRMHWHCLEDLIRTSAADDGSGDIDELEVDNARVCPLCRDDHIRKVLFLGECVDGKRRRLGESQEPPTPILVRVTQPMPPSPPNPIQIDDDDDEDEDEDEIDRMFRSVEDEVSDTVSSSESESDGEHDAIRNNNSGSRKRPRAELTLPTTRGRPRVQITLPRANNNNNNNNTRLPRGFTYGTSTTSRGSTFPMHINNAHRGRRMGTTNRVVTPRRNNQ
jgi:hypothetical protein